MLVEEVIEESLYSLNKINNIAKNIMDEHIVPFISSKIIKKSYDITDFFETDYFKDITMYITSDIYHHGTAKINGKYIEINLFINKNKFNYDKYFKLLKHEIEHVFQYIQTNGKKHKYDKRPLYGKYNSEIEFNQKVHEFVDIVKKPVKYIDKEQMLMLIRKSTTNTFADFLEQNEEKYKEFIRRLYRERFLK